MRIHTDTQIGAVGFAVLLAATLGADVTQGSPLQSNRGRGLKLDAVLEAQLEFSARGSSTTSSETPIYETFFRTFDLSYLSSESATATSSVDPYPEFFLTLSPIFEQIERVCLVDTKADPTRQRWCEGQLVPQFSVRQGLAPSFTAEIGRLPWARLSRAHTFASVFDRFFTPLRPTIDSWMLEGESDFGIMTLLVGNDVTTADQGEFNAVRTQPLPIFSWGKRISEDGEMSFTFFRYDANHAAFGQMVYSVGSALSWNASFIVQADVRQRRFGGSMTQSKVAALSNETSLRTGAWQYRSAVSGAWSAQEAVCSQRTGALGCRDAFAGRSWEGEVFLGRILGAETTIGSAIGTKASLQTLDPQRSVCDYGHCAQTRYISVRLQQSF